MGERSSEGKQAVEPCLNTFSIQKTAVEIKVDSVCPEYLQKDDKRTRIYPREKSVKATKLGKYSTCKQKTGPCLHKCKMQMTFLQMKRNNDRMRNKLRILQDKVREKDKEVKRLKRLLKSSSGRRNKKSDESSDSTRSSSSDSETL